jgi:hypothetical protein
MPPSTEKKRKSSKRTKSRKTKPTNNDAGSDSDAIMEEYGGGSSSDDNGRKQRGGSRRSGRARREAKQSEGEEDAATARDFKRAVVQYITFDNKSRQLREMQSEINSKKKELSEIIIGRMNDMRMKTIAITGGRLHRNKAESQAPLKKDMILETLKKELGGKRADVIFEKMQERRPVTTRINLKRVKDREAEAAQKKQQSRRSRG